MWCQTNEDLPVLFLNFVSELSRLEFTRLTNDITGLVADDRIAGLHKGYICIAKDAEAELVPAGLQIDVNLALACLARFSTANKNLLVFNQQAN